MNNTKDNLEKTNFSFTKGSFNNKKSLVNNIFSNVAIKYDIMNDLMSFGIHRLWKDKFSMHVLNLNSYILDIASGTGDIAFRIINRAKKQNKNLQITLCDINQEMLNIAINKAIDNNLLQGLNYVCADAENLPFADNSFDYYTIAFGIRNVVSIENLLKEALRVLKPTGKFLCLEFSKLQYSTLKRFYDFYSFNIIPKLGQLVTNNEGAYQYLIESISLFPDQETFKIMIQEVGFSKVRYENLTFGIAAIHSAYKL